MLTILICTQSVSKEEIAEGQMLMYMPIKLAKIVVTHCSVCIVW